ncbi:class II aldolase/adducin family protein [Streptomyces sp. AS02]|uniref:class II aldolase/adducin family protein n=1 Tax=Streptomyces sp. AS02 TaxID=2938946 RepID=UPI0020214CC3|nr:class II aldolase/adducin family protein [Streptomyces sp. AS02]MCL8014937.1 class II aldolase/adducin family protein [Streptomyces sp. AS02]
MEADVTEQVRAAVAKVCHDLERLGLVVGTAGNVSVRVGERFAVTGTGVVLGRASAADVVVVDGDGALVEGRIEPSSETALHLYAYAGGDVGAVVHTHSPAATAVSVITDELPCVHYQQLLLGGATPVVPFAVFGSRSLATSVSRALVGRKAVILAGHGAVTVGRDLDEAVQNCLLLEWASDLYLRAASAGTPRSLTPAQQGAVIEAALRSGYGSRKRAGTGRGS